MLILLFPCMNEYNKVIINNSNQKLFISVQAGYNKNKI